MFGKGDGGRTITRAAKDPLVIASGISIARLHARVAVSQSRAGIASRIVWRAVYARG